MMMMMIELSLTCIFFQIGVWGIQSPLTWLPLSIGGVNTYGPTSGRDFSARTLPAPAAKRVAAIQRAVQNKRIPAVAAITKIQQYSSAAHLLAVASTVPVAQSLQSGAAEGYLALSPAMRTQRSGQRFLIAHFFGGHNMLDNEDGQVNDMAETWSILDAQVDPTQELFGPFYDLADRAYKGWVEGERALDGKVQGTGARKEEVIMIRGKNQDEVHVLSLYVYCLSAPVIHPYILSSFRWKKKMMTTKKGKPQWRRPAVWT